jgi:phospholipase/lecithinase/hemolysin
MLTARRIVFALALLSPALAAAQTQNYTSIVVFGDSLSDTGNDATLSYLKYGVPLPSPDAVGLLGPTSDYTFGRFTDGPDSTPASTEYFGVWVEQLADLLPSHPVVKNSLSGGADYAYGDALAANGPSIAAIGPYAITIQNVGLQISTYLATHPSISKHTLFVVWGGANDLLTATTPEQVIQAALDETSNVEKLVDAGASQIIVPNLPPLGKTPALLGTPQAATANQATVLFNDTLSLGLDLVELAHFFDQPKLFRLDVYSLFNQIDAHPATYGITNMSSPAQEQPVNPDTYLFWDTLHPTTKGHYLLAEDALQLVDPAAAKAPTRPNVSGGSGH